MCKMKWGEFKWSRKTERIYKLLTAKGITMTAVYTGYASEDKEHLGMDSFNITLCRKNGIDIQTKYSMGVGHRAVNYKMNMGPSEHYKTPRHADMMQLKTGSRFIRVSSTEPHIARYVHCGGKTYPGDYSVWVRTPNIYEAVMSLFLDADFADAPFEDWCANLGYDEDSRKAFAIWEQCNAIRRQLRAFFTERESRFFTKLLQDY